MGKKMYMAYDSNTYAPQMGRRCPDFRIIGTAMLRDFELEFRGAATIVPKPGTQVPVLLWEISELDEIRLDVCEGVPHSYRKETYDVEINGQTVSGMVYVKNGGAITPPKDGYVCWMLLGYQQNCMNVQYIHQVLEKALLAQTDAIDDGPEEINDMNITQN